MCKKIHRGGNAEQYHADKKYKEAVAVAVEACAEDTNYALSLCKLGRSEEAKSWLREMIPIALRTLGETDEVTLSLRKFYAMALFVDAGATLDDIREAVTMLEDLERTRRRVFGGTHPATAEIRDELRNARAKLRARETQP
jgi:hypothetical protein